jgi:hypothetical protein
LNRTDPETVARGGTIPVSASDISVLPEPLSPTTPTISPAATNRSTSRTGRTLPRSVAISMLSPLTSSNGGGPLASETMIDSLRAMRS